MTKEEWINEANRRIVDNLEFRAEVQEMSSREPSWSEYKRQSDNARLENLFLMEGIKLLQEQE